MAFVEQILDYYIQNLIGLSRYHKFALAKAQLKFHLSSELVLEGFERKLVDHALELMWIAILCYSQQQINVLQRYRIFRLIIRAYIESVLLSVESVATQIDFENFLGLLIPFGDREYPFFVIFWFYHHLIQVW